MGYCIEMKDSHFKIKKENMEAAYQAALEEVHESWRNDLRTLVEVLEQWCYIPELDETGDIVSLEFEGEKLRDEYDIFKAIAPFVEKDSYLEMKGENGSIWRWAFDGVTCKEISPTITW